MTVPALCLPLRRRHGRVGPGLVGVYAQIWAAVGLQHRCLARCWGYVENELDVSERNLGRETDNGLKATPTTQRL